MDVFIISASSTEGNPTAHQNANYLSLRLAKFQLIFLHVSLSKLHPRPVCWTLLSTQGKQKTETEKQSFK